MDKCVTSRGLFMLAGVSISDFRRRAPKFLPQIFTLKSPLWEENEEFFLHVHGT
ncbi:unnamed protein product [Ascophyllum nodosum]